VFAVLTQFVLTLFVSRRRCQLRPSNFARAILRDIDLSDRSATYRSQLMTFTVRSRNLRRGLFSDICCKVFTHDPAGSEWATGQMRCSATPKDIERFSQVLASAKCRNMLIMFINFLCFLHFRLRCADYRKRVVYKMIGTVSRKLAQASRCFSVNSAASVCKP